MAEKRILFDFTTCWRNSDAVFPTESFKVLAFGTDQPILSIKKENKDKKEYVFWAISNEYAKEFICFREKNLSSIIKEIVSLKNNDSNYSYRIVDNLLIVPAFKKERITIIEDLKTVIEERFKEYYLLKLLKKEKEDGKAKG